MIKLNLQFFGDQSGTADAADASNSDTSNTDTSNADTGSTGDTSSSSPNTSSSSGGGGGADPNANERSYLSNMASGYDQYGNPVDQGQQSWAQSQLDSMNATGTTGTTSTAPSGGGSLLTNAVGNIASGNIPVTTWNNGQGNSFTAQVYNGRSIASIGDLSKSLGFNYKVDPNTGAVSVNGQTINPVSNGANGSSVQVRQVLNALGVPDQEISYDPKTGNVSYTAPQQSREQPQQQQYQRNPYQQQPYQMQMPYIGPQPQMSQYVNNTPFQAPDLSSYYNNLMPVQQQFTPDWNTYYNQAHQQFDPTTNSDMQSLITKMNQDITSSDEKMNTRGIFNSGLAQANEDLIRGNSSNAIAKVLATSQSNIAKVAQQLFKDAQTQWYQGNTLALQNNKLMLDQALAQEKQAYTQWLGGQNLNLNQYKAALTAWDNSANMALKQAQLSLDTYKFNNLSADQAANLNQRDFQYNNLSAQQKATDAISQQKNQLDLFKMLGYVQNPDGSVTPTEQATNDQQNLAIKLAQTLGYYTTPDGKIIPTQQAQYQDTTLQQNQQKINLDQQKLVAQIHQWANDNQLKSAQIGLDQQKLTEQTNKDQAMIDKASQAAQSETQKVQLDALKAQLTSVSNMIKQKQASLQQGQTLSDTDPLIVQYNSIIKAVDQVANINSSSGSTPQTDEFGNVIGNTNFNNVSGGGDYNNYYKAQQDQGTSAYNNGMASIQKAMTDEGVPSSWLQPLMEIAARESDFNTNADGKGLDPTSTAYGLFQLNNDNYNQYGQGVNRNDAYGQAVAGIRYIKSRYGDPITALNTWDYNAANSPQGYGWY